MIDFLIHWERFKQEIEQVTPLAFVIGSLVLIVVILVGSAGVDDE